ncbi:MAG: hypothetical protein LBC30_03240 [Puniceicoccales bacterium]|nr:hypothetical protein [Puniceicoccales bacterium]
MWYEILFAIRNNFYNIIAPMEVKHKNIDQANKATSVDPADAKSKSLFAGRTFGMGAGNKTFMTKEVKSALDTKSNTRIDADDPNSKPEDVADKK